MKMLVTALAMFIALLACKSDSANSATVVRYSPGGHMALFAIKYDRMSRTGEKLVIDGGCWSACTMFLGFIRPENVCVTERAKLGFHTATETADHGKKKSWVHSQDGTKRLWSLYPENIKAALRKRGWNGDRYWIAHPDFVVLQGKTLRALVRPCN
jgi:hypothetical protein